MKTGRLVASILVMGMILWVGASAFAGNGTPQGNHKTSGLRTLTEAETATLKFMLEEEKLARDVYLAMQETWGSTVFVNIAASEQRHMDAIKNLLDKYSVPDPASETIGVFNDQSLQVLYDQLIAGGMLSELDAFMVGGLIEEVDIEDLNHAMEETEKIDLLAVYGNLLSGSVNHLTAFAANVESFGLVYEAQYLPQEIVDGLLVK
jgi:hypothetical protein